MRWRRLRARGVLAVAVQRGHRRDHVVRLDRIDRAVVERLRVRERAAPVRLVAAAGLPRRPLQREVGIARGGEGGDGAAARALGNRVDAAAAGAGRCRWRRRALRSASPPDRARVRRCGAVRQSRGAAPQDRAPVSLTLKYNPCALSAYRPGPSVFKEAAFSAMFPSPVVPPVEPPIQNRTGLLRTLQPLAGNIPPSGKSPIKQIVSPYSGDESTTCTKTLGTRCRISREGGNPWAFGPMLLASS